MVHSVVLIGDSRRREFAGFASWLCDQPQLRIDAHFATPADALAADEQILTQADLTIVLQSWSDQFTDQEAGALIGATLFRRLLCCYGPWCESDGRNRSVWPDAHRVPLRIARRIVEWEVLRLQRGEPAVPPTSARDEIFAYRLGEPEEWAPLPEFLNQTAVVVGPDRVLRQTVAALLQEFGLHARDTPLFDDHADLSETVDELSRAQVSLVVHDLDPWSGRVAASLDRVCEQFPQAEILGTASMPDAGLRCETADVDLPCIVPKLDLDDSLRWILHELSQPRRLHA